MATSRLQSLNCPICNELLEDQKILDCTHTFCVKCLEKTVEGCEVKCPICREITDVKDGDISRLRKNVVLSSVIDDVKKLVRCNAKDDPSHKENAVFFCQECNSYFCSGCFDIHNQLKPNRRHTTFPAEEYRQQILPSPSVSDSGSTDKEGHVKQVCVNCNKRVSSSSEKDCVHATKNHSIITETEYASIIRSKAEQLQTEVTETLAMIRTLNTSYASLEQGVRSFSYNVISAINEAYYAKERQLKDWKLTLTKYCQTLQENVSRQYKEIERLRASDTRNLVEMSNLVGIGLDENRNITAFAEICNNLSRSLTAVKERARDSPLEEKMTAAISMSFQFNHVDHGSLITTTWQTSTHDLQACKNMSAVDTNKEERIAIGYFEGGVEFFESGNKMLHSRIVLEDTGVLGLAFSRDGGLVVRDIKNKIQLFSAEMEPQNNEYGTLSHEVGGDGCLDVDCDDNIYVSYRSVKKIHIFARKGGKAIREIDCLTYTPQQIVVSSTQKIFVMDGSVTTMFTDTGPSSTQIMYSGCHGYPCVSSDGSVLVAWVDRANSLLRIDKHSEDFKAVKCIYSSNTIDLSGRAWYFLRELSRGHLAFCTNKKLIILKQKVLEIK